ncbi:MAG: methyltransferase domain-containing protein [Ferruginibacter sp.]
MIDLSQRSGKKELLDEPDIPFADIKQNMLELNFINTRLGGHSITLKGLKQLLSGRNTPITICEIGCGGGDNLSAIYKWCIKNKMAVTFIGIDLKKECIDFARQKYPQLPAIWITSDYILSDLPEQPDIIFSSLFCHHFSNNAIVSMLQWMQGNCRIGFFINDLQRNFFAYYSIWWLTKIFSRSYLVKNDAPLSVARGFHKIEWQRLFLKAGIKVYVINWQWAFRYLIVCKKGG